MQPFPESQEEEDGVMEVSQSIEEELGQLPDALTNLQGRGGQDGSSVETPNFSWSQTGVEQEVCGGQGDFAVAALRPPEEDSESANKRFRPQFCQQECSLSPGGDDCYPVSSIPTDAALLGGLEVSAFTSGFLPPDREGRG